MHTFDGRAGGRFRISLTYNARDRVGETTAHTDTYHGRFVALVPNELVVEVEEFGTADPALRGEITITLADADGGTNLVAVHDGLPAGVSPADNEAGWRKHWPGSPRSSRPPPHRGPGRATRAHPHATEPKTRPHVAVRAVNAGHERLWSVATGVALVARRVGGVRRTPAVCRRRLTPLRLKA